MFANKVDDKPTDTQWKRFHTYRRCAYHMDLDIDFWSCLKKIVAVKHSHFGPNIEYSIPVLSENLLLHFSKNILKSNSGCMKVIIADV